jgi:hypothetical protein
MLGMAGICPALIQHIEPFIRAIPEIKAQLFGNASTTQASIVDSFLAGMALSLERIRVQHGDQWRPYDGELSGDHVFEFFNQVANTELNQLIEHAANHEATNTAMVFETLLETCFNFTITVPNLPHSIPDYTAAPGALTEALMAKGVYSALAIKIETAWKTAWSQFVGKLLIIEYSNSSSSSNSGSSSSTSSQAQSTVYYPEATLSLDEYDLRNEQTNQMPASTGPVPYLDSPQAQDLLETFRHQLRLVVDQPGENILVLPKDTLEVSANTDIVYSELMFRQLHMLKQFITTTVSS